MADDSRLAIQGGTPVLPQGPPDWPRPDQEVRAALEAAYADGTWGRYHGPHCERLKTLLGELCGVSQIWLCSSGTVAVELALRGLKISAGDEVIVAAYDFPGNFRAIEAVGARPVLVDLAARTWTLDVEQVRIAIKDNTRAVIVSHLHGSLADMRRLRRIADARGIAVVEDACQAPGAIVAGRPAGSWGDCGVLSFGGSKLLTAGRGGAVVTYREDVLQRIKIHSERGNDAYPLSELQAAVLAPQIPKLAEQNARRLNAVKRLLWDCKQAAGMTPTAMAENGDQSAFYKIAWLLTGNSDDCSRPEFEQLRGQFAAAVRAEGVALDEGFRGFARRGQERCRIVGDLANARRAAAGTVILHHPVLLESDLTICLVAQAINKVCAAFFAR
jgi:dTDP-4-amino-4,6-dideoxygalactose transaminase